MQCNKNYFKSLVILYLLCIAVYCHAQYAIKNDAFVTGSVQSTDSTTYNLNSVAGQNLTGISENDEFVVYSGFLYPEEAIASALKGELSDLPVKFELYQNYPNPFNPSTHIKYALPKASHVTINVYNIIGQHILTLIDADKQAGYHTIVFNIEHLPSGLYFYSINADHYHQVKKMVVIK